MTDNVLDLALVRWFGEFAEHGIFTTDQHLTVTSWNRWLERHTGRAARDVVGRPLFDSYPDLKDRGFDEHYVEALGGHGHLVSHLLHRYLIAMPARVGERSFATMPQRARIAPLMADGRIVGTITVIDDVSERFASEQELQRQIEAQRVARTAAEEALRVKDEFLATLSHEIRTPLNAVLGWARILKEREVEPPMLARALDSIFRNATVQARMIDDLLDTARIMSGKLRLQMQPVDLLTVTLAALDVLSPVIEAKKIALKRTLDPGTDRVLGDPDRLQQIIWNLLSNAAKFTDGGGTIEIRLQQVDRTVRIIVADTGKGISAEFLPLIFERFRQADVSSSRREGGLGLGLALVRELVELHGGQVRADSAGHEKGATFVVEFPAIASPDRRGAAHGAAPKASGARSLRGVHVLLVEDEQDARELLSVILSESGAEVTAVASCVDAINYIIGAADEHRPDVLVSDIRLADEDGCDLITRVRGLPPHQGGELPAVAVTDHPGAGEGSRAVAAGYQVHVSKPVDAQALVTAISRVLWHADV